MCYFYWCFVDLHVHLFVHMSNETRLKCLSASNKHQFLIKILREHYCARIETRCTSRILDSNWLICTWFPTVTPTHWKIFNMNFVGMTIKTENIQNILEFCCTDFGTFLWKNVKKLLQKLMKFLHKRHTAITNWTKTFILKAHSRYFVAYHATY